MITTYQIRNVLRIYGNQLKKNTLTIKEKAAPPKHHAEIVDISMQARSRQMVSRMSDNLISMVTSKDHQQDKDKNIPDNSLSQYPEDERENHEDR